MSKCRSGPVLKILGRYRRDRASEIDLFLHAIADYHGLVYRQSVLVNSHDNVICRG